MTKSNKRLNRRGRAARGADVALFATLRARVFAATLAALAAASLLLPPPAHAGVQNAAAGSALGTQAPGAAAAPHRISPHILAARQRAQAPKPEHLPKLQLTARGPQGVGAHGARR